MLSSNGYGLGDNTEMDLTPDSNADQPSPATTTSNTRSQSLSHSGGAGSGSHSSYSPGQPTDQIPYRPSPQMAHQLPNHSASTLNNIFYSTSNDMMNGTFNYGDTGGIPPVGDSIPADFNMGILGNDWDMGGLSGGTGMTPMSEGAWNQMLENINMGWDSVGPSHVDARQGR